jgi:hypothetical protein
MSNTNTSPATVYSNIPAKVVKALLRFASKDVTRYSLNGIRFEGSTGNIVATSGATLARLTWRPDTALTKSETVGAGDCTVPAALLASAVKAAGAKGTIKVMFRADDADPKLTRVVLWAGGIEFAGVAIADRFPPWAQVVPKASGSKIGHYEVDPKFLVDLAELATALDGPNSGVRMMAGGGLDPILYQTKNARCDVVIMPRIMK